ncbi:MAG: STAS-like domain-containing protein [Candidatus Cloacimonadia bacterium]
MKINVKEEIGKRCIIREDGQKIYNKIHNELKVQRIVVLNFEGVKQFASPFFNFAVGQLLKDVEEKDVRTYLHIEKLNETGRRVFDRVIENAARYHKDVNYQKLIHDVICKEVEEPK